MPSKCRYCNMSLDGEEIIEVLSKQKYFHNCDRHEVEKAARMYGWTPENKKCFKKDVLMQLGKQQFELCPECCGISPRDLCSPKTYYFS